MEARSQAKLMQTQPYVIICDDGSWLCILTTSSGIEHAYMNNIIATRSYDKGRTWTEPVNVEPPGVHTVIMGCSIKSSGWPCLCFFIITISMGFEGIRRSYEWAFYV